MSDELFPEATWISLEEVSQILDVPVNKVRQLIAEGAIASLRVGTPPAPRIPAEFFQDGEIVKNLGGTLTVLADSGFENEEALRWLFTADETLPGTPIQALREDRGREVRRRAQALSF